ncbi:hypothetical protein [Ekhidna sp.]|uniref:hypothetical protein n=1 Tax=Ekhidna sp. TaxID=2608089 RepID=UPI003CCBA894
MKNKFKKLVNISYEDFGDSIANNEIQLRPARLIPLVKVGDEMALTSIFLSALKYVDEYRNSFFSDIKLSKAGTAHFYTEVCFPKLSKHRFDGLVIVVSAGKIKDAAFFEMKNKNNEIDSKQIQSYMEVIKSICADKMITVSNQFAPNQSQLPYVIKGMSKMNNYHFSWTYLLTIAHLLITKNETNIEDNDQNNIMNEVLRYLEAPESGVTNFNKMKPGWKEVAERIMSKSILKPKDDKVIEAVESWVQEEKDMGLMLSRELGVMVKLGRDSKKYKIDSDIKKLIKSNHLESRLKVIGSVSEILIEADFTSRTVSMSVEVDAPLDKGTKGRLGWILRQIERCKQKYDKEFDSIANELYVDAAIKYRSNGVRHKFSDFESFYELEKSIEITQFKILVIRNFGRNFESVRKFVEMIESMLLEFYKVIIQNLSNWDRPAPKLKNESNS